MHWWHNEVDITYLLDKSSNIHCDWLEVKAYWLQIVYEYSSQNKAPQIIMLSFTPLKI